MGSVTDSLHEPMRSASVRASACLCEHDRKVLADREIPLELARANAVRTITAAEAPAYGFRGRHALDGLLIPLYDTAGDISGYQLRPHTPPIEETTRADGTITRKQRKYLFPAGQRMRLYVPLASLPTLEDPAVPILLTESPLKALALTAAIEPGTLCVIAVSGCWNWRSQDRPLSDHKDIPWKVKEGDRIRKHRLVYVLYDSDASTNANVSRARWEYGEYLRDNRKAAPWYIDVPAAVDGSKQGIDDALAAGHTLAALMATAYRAPQTPPEIGTDTDDDTDRVPEIERLRAENAALKRQNRALMLIVKNPEVKDTRKMVWTHALTIAAHKASRGEIEPDGRVMIEPRYAGHDHREAPKKGESKLERNPLDGTKPLTSRDKVVGIMEEAAAAGVVTGFEVRRVAKQNDDGTWSKYPEILLDPPQLTENLEKIATHAPADAKPRKAYTRQKECLHCGERHEWAVVCTGCGSETEKRRNQPGPELTIVDDDYTEPTTETPAATRRDDAPPPGYTKKVNPRSVPSSAPASPPTSIVFTKKVNPPIREEIEHRMGTATPQPPAPAGPLFDSAPQPPETPPKTCVYCSDPLPPGRQYTCEPCAAIAEREHAERWQQSPRAS